jgi:hypothetical protein
MTADLRHRYRAIVGHLLAKTASSVPDKARMDNGVHSVALSYGGNPYRHRDFHHGPWHSLAAALQDMALYAIWSLGPWSMARWNLQTSHVKETICHSGNMLPRCLHILSSPYVHRYPLESSYRAAPTIQKGVLSFPSCSSPRPKLSRWLSVAYTCS